MTIYQDRRSFAVVSPDRTGQTTTGKRAPMLGSGPFPTGCPKCLPGREDSGSGESWFEPRRGNSKAQHHIRGVGPSSYFSPCYRFCYGFPTAPAVRRPTSLVGDAITRGSRPGAVSASCRCPETLDEWPARRSSRRRTSGWCPIGRRRGRVAQARTASIVGSSRRSTGAPPANHSVPATKTCRSSGAWSLVNSVPGCCRPCHRR